jgi:hypothetical protein
MNTTPARDTQHAAARLAALKANLDARSITTRTDPGSLAVLDSGGRQVDTLTCKPWPVDCDRWWFFDCTGTAIAEADDVIGAALVIVGNLRRAGIHA